MQGMMLYFSGSGVQIFSLGMIFMLLTGPITSVLGIFKGEPSRAVHKIGMDRCVVHFLLLLNLNPSAFEAFRPTIPSRNGKEPEQLSYGPLILPMLAYVGSQGLV